MQVVCGACAWDLGLGYSGISISIYAINTWEKAVARLRLRLKLGAVEHERSS